MVAEELSVLRSDLTTTSGEVHHLDSSLSDLTASVNQLYDSIQELRAGRNVSH